MYADVVVDYVCVDPARRPPTLKLFTKYANEQLVNILDPDEPRMFEFVIRSDAPAATVVLVDLDLFYPAKMPQDEVELSALFVNLHKNQVQRHKGKYVFIFPFPLGERVDSYQNLPAIIVNFEDEDRVMRIGQETLWRSGSEASWKDTTPAEQVARVLHTMLTPYVEQNPGLTRPLGDKTFQAVSGSYTEKPLRKRYAERLRNDQVNVRWDEKRIEQERTVPMDLVRRHEIAQSIVKESRGRSGVVFYLIGSDFRTTTLEYHNDTREEFDNEAYYERAELSWVLMNRQTLFKPKKKNMPRKRISYEYRKMNCIDFTRTWAVGEGLLENANIRSEFQRMLAGTRPSCLNSEEYRIQASQGVAPSFEMLFTWLMCSASGIPIHVDLKDPIAQRFAEIRNSRSLAGFVIYLQRRSDITLAQELIESEGVDDKYYTECRSHVRKAIVVTYSKPRDAISLQCYVDELGKPRVPHDWPNMESFLEWIVTEDEAWKDADMCVSGVQLLLDARVGLQQAIYKVFVPVSHLSTMQRKSFETQTEYQDQAFMNVASLHALGKSLFSKRETLSKEEAENGTLADFENYQAYIGKALLERTKKDPTKSLVYDKLPGFRTDPRRSAFYLFETVGRDLGDIERRRYAVLASMFGPSMGVDRGGNGVKFASGGQEDKTPFSNWDPNVAVDSVARYVYERELSLGIKAQYRFDNHFDVKRMKAKYETKKFAWMAFAGKKLALVKLREVRSKFNAKVSVRLACANYGKSLLRSISTSSDEDEPSENYNQDPDLVYPFVNGFEFVLTRNRTTVLENNDPMKPTDVALMTSELQLLQGRWELNAVGLRAEYLVILLTQLSYVSRAFVFMLEDASGISGTDKYFRHFYIDGATYAMFKEIVPSLYSMPKFGFLALFGPRPGQEMSQIANTTFEPGQLKDTFPAVLQWYRDEKIKQSGNDNNKDRVSSIENAIFSLDVVNARFQVWMRLMLNFRKAINACFNVSIGELKEYVRNSEEVLRSNKNSDYRYPKGSNANELIDVLYDIPDDQNNTNAFRYALETLYEDSEVYESVEWVLSHLLTKKDRTAFSLGGITDFEQEFIRMAFLERPDPESGFSSELSDALTQTWFKLRGVQLSIWAAQNQTHTRSSRKWSRKAKFLPQLAPARKERILLLKNVEENATPEAKRPRRNTSDDSNAVLPKPPITNRPSLRALSSSSPRLAETGTNDAMDVDAVIPNRVDTDDAMDVDAAIPNRVPYTRASERSAVQNRVSRQSDTNVSSRPAPRRPNIANISVQQVASQNPLFTSYAQMLQNKNKTSSSSSQIKPLRQTRPL